MADFKERMGNQSALLDSINGNPLPASYQVSFYYSYGKYRGNRHELIAKQRLESFTPKIS